VAIDLQGRLAVLGIQLPAYTPPTASYEPWIEVSGQLLLSGHVSILPGTEHRGRLGESMSLDEGKRAAEVCAMGLLSRMNAALRGSWDGFDRLVRLNVFVASTSDFSLQAEVANAASDIFLEVLGDSGRHIRTAVGVAALPRGAAVEIDLVAQLRRVASNVRD
jgi:enamine deaminase RidA (YjgF/YER057c/UK114 family)